MFLPLFLPLVGSQSVGWLAGWLVDFLAGCYSQWLEKKKARLDAEKKQDDQLKKTLASELDWVS